MSCFNRFVGRPSPLYFAKRLTAKCGGANIWLKREDLNHTGAHKINNTLGQALLTLRMGKTRVIAETGAGQHGVATATACAHFGLPCVVYMARKMFDARSQCVQHEVDGRPKFIRSTPVRRHCAMQSMKPCEIGCECRAYSLHIGSVEVFRIRFP